MRILLTDHRRVKTLLFAYVYLDPDNPPTEIMLQFNDGSWNHRAVWGDKNAIDWGELGTASRDNIMGELPPLGEVDAVGRFQLPRSV
jgi:hypothetical protein